MYKDVKNLIYNSWYLRDYMNALNYNISKTTNKILMDKIFLEAMTKAKIKISFLEYLPLKDLIKLVQTTNNKYTYAIDPNIIEDVDNIYFAEHFLNSPIRLQTKLLKKNQNNYHFISQVLLDNGGYGDQVLLNFVKKMDIESIISDPKMIEVIFKRVPYFLLELLSTNPHLLDGFPVDEWLVSNEVQNWVNKRYKYHLAVYLYFDKNHLLDSVIKSNYQGEKLSEFLLDLSEEYEPYMQATVDLFSSIGYTCIPSKNHIYKNIKHYDALIADLKTNNVDKIKPIDLVNGLTNEEDLLYYYHLKKWKLTVIDLFYQKAQQNGFTILMENTQEDIKKLKDKTTKTLDDLKYFWLHIDIYKNNKEIVLLLLSKIKKFKELYRIISNLSEDFLNDQDLIAAFVKNTDETGKYTYYYFKNLYIAFTCIFFEQLQRGWCWSEEMRNDVVFYKVYREYCKQIDPTSEDNSKSEGSFDRSIRIKYLQSLPTITLADIEYTKIYLVGFPGRSKFPVCVYYEADKETIIQILSVVLSQKVDTWYSFYDPVDTKPDDIVEILERSGWPFLYEGKHLLDDTSGTGLRDWQSGPGESKLMEIYAKNMIKYAGEDFLDLLETDFFFIKYELYTFYKPKPDAEYYRTLIKKLKHTKKCVLANFIIKL